MNDMRAWLTSIGLVEYADAFEANDLTWELLRELDHDTLKEVGVASAGHRLRILRAATTLDDESDTSDEAPAPSKTLDSAERRQLTVMFCDLVGSTELSASMDAEDYRELLAAYQGAAVAAVRRYDGFVARYMGDGLLIYFGYPVATENDGERAALAGLELVEAVAGLDTSAPLAVRVGIATGSVVVGDIVGEGASEEAAVLGDSPNLAARLQGHALPGSVLLSPTTDELVRGRVETEALAPVVLKGLSKPIVPYRAVRPRPLDEVESAPTLLIGREVELALLQRAWRRAESGEGQAVLLSGEAGVGKSRLLHAIQGEVQAGRTTQVQWHCSPFHRTTASFPAMEQLTRVLGEKSVDALERLVRELRLDVGSMVPALAHLLSVPLGREYQAPDWSPGELKQQMIQAQVDLLLAAARSAPVLFSVEDLHWVDPTTLDVLAALVAAIRDEPVFMVMTARPTFVPPWGDQAHATTQHLSSLSRAETVALIRNIVDQPGLSDTLIDQIVKRTDGVPLFVEELTKTVLESHGSAGIPASLQDSLMARLDRLETAKELAQIAAVIGRNFSYDELAAMVSWPEVSLSERLHRLIDSGLVNRRKQNRFEFKHALVRDVAYDSLLRDRKRELHGRFTRYLTGKLPRGEQPELVAYHQERASSHEDAARSWMLAGELAAMRGANREAVAHFEAGLTSVERLEDSEVKGVLELGLLSALGPVLMQSLGYGASEVGETYQRFRELAQSRVGTAAQWFDATFGLWMHAHGMADFSRARKLIDELFALCEGNPEDSRRIQAWHAAWTTGFNTGEFDSSHRHAEHAVALYRRDAHCRLYLTYAGHDPRVCAHIHDAMALWFLGYAERAAEQAALSLVRATELSHPSTLVVSRFFGLLLAQYSRDAERVHACALEVIDLTTKHGPVTWLAASRVLLGWSMAALGDPGKGFDLSRGALSDYQATGNMVRYAYYRALHAEVCLMAGRLSEAGEHVRQGLSISAATGESHWDAELHRLAGEIGYLDGQPELGLDHLQKAVGVARTQGARVLELRARLAMWRHADSEPERDEQLAGVRELYRGFDEGFDTADLRAAAEILS